MKRILEGVRRFQEDIFPQERERFQSLADRQAPEALFITCADSRVLPNLITQAPPGDLFICRNAGNMVPPFGELAGGVSATIEYAVAALGVRHIIICGHSDCGAMKGVLYPEKVAEMPMVAAWLRQGEAARQVVLSTPGLDEQARLDRLIEQNVVAQLHHLRTHPTVAVGLSRGTLEIHGWVYTIASGRIVAYDAAAERFVEPRPDAIPSATPTSNGRTAA